MQETDGSSDSRAGYSFTFMRQEGNRTLTRKETQDSSGFVRGIYWIQEPNGIFRLISYEADADHRFQAKVLTNRPGEVNVTFPASQLPLQVSAIIPVSSPSKTLAPDPSDVSSAPSSARLDSQSNQLSSDNCSLAPQSLLMTTLPTDAETETETTTTATTTTDVTHDLEFETFPSTSVMETTTSESETTTDVTTSAAGETTTTQEAGDDESANGSIDAKVNRYKGRNGNDSQKQPSRARSKGQDKNLPQETTTETTSTSTTMEDMNDLERETTSVLPSARIEPSDLMATTSSTIFTTTTTTAKVEKGLSEDSRPPTPLPQVTDDVTGSGEAEDGDALRYFLEYRIPVLDGGSVYRKEGTDARGRVIGSYMFLVHDKEDINHKRQQVARKGRVKQGN